MDSKFTGKVRTAVGNTASFRLVDGKIEVSDEDADSDTDESDAITLILPINTFLLYFLVYMSLFTMKNTLTKPLMSGF